VIDDEVTEIGDGGFIDWTAKLTGNKKERQFRLGPAERHHGGRERR
jgi:hypothetical protein